MQTADDRLVNEISCATRVTSNLELQQTKYPHDVLSSSPQISGGSLRSQVPMKTAMVRAASPEGRPASYAAGPTLGSGLTMSQIPIRGCAGDTRSNWLPSNAARAQTPQEPHVQPSVLAGVAWEAGTPARGVDAIQFKAIPNEVGSMQPCPSGVQEAGDANLPMMSTPRILGNPPLQSQTKSSPVRVGSPVGRLASRIVGPAVSQGHLVGQHSSQRCASPPQDSQGSRSSPDPSRAYTPQPARLQSSTLFQSGAAWEAGTLADVDAAKAQSTPTERGTCQGDSSMCQNQSGSLKIARYLSSEPQQKNTIVRAVSPEGPWASRTTGPATSHRMSIHQLSNPTCVSTSSELQGSLPSSGSARLPIPQEARVQSCASLAVSDGQRASIPSLASGLHLNRPGSFTVGTSLTASQAAISKSSGTARALTPQEPRARCYLPVASVASQRESTPTLSSGPLVRRCSASYSVPAEPCKMVPTMEVSRSRSAQSGHVKIAPCYCADSGSPLKGPDASHGAKAAPQELSLSQGARETLQAPMEAWRWPGQAGEVQEAIKPADNAEAQNIAILDQPGTHDDRLVISRQASQSGKHESFERKVNGKAVRQGHVSTHGDREGYLDGSPCHTVSGAALIERFSSILDVDEDDSGSAQETDSGSTSPQNGAKLENMSLASTAEDESEIQLSLPIDINSLQADAARADFPDTPFSTLSTGTTIFEAAMSKTVTAEEARHPQRAGIGRLLLQHSKPALRPLGLAKNSDADVVRRLFFDSMPDSIVTIDSIEQLISPKLLRRFLKTVAKERGAVEATFHGTKPDLAATIVSEGLSTSICQTGAYGHGAYVGTHAGVAHQYADPDKDDRRYMCLVLVVAGKQVVRGQQGEQPRATALDKLSNPTQYCFVDEERLLVSHMITYRAQGSARKRIGGGWQDLYQIKLSGALRRAAKRLRKHGFR